MPRFHMNIRKADELLEDWEGEEFPSLVEARAEAVLAAREMISARVTAGKKPVDPSRFEIMDDNGKLVLVVPFEEAFDRS